jgi:hypothetical protein
MISDAWVHCPRNSSDKFCAGQDAVRVKPRRLGDEGESGHGRVMKVDVRVNCGVYPVVLKLGEKMLTKPGVPRIPLM